MKNKNGMLVVFSGPSGAGKGTILAEYLRRGTEAVCSVSATTRKPRPGEIDGVHYHFVTKEAFEEMIDLQGKTQSHTGFIRDFFRIHSQRILRQTIDNPHRVIRFQCDMHDLPP